MYAVPKTCDGYVKLGMTRSGQYDIDPDGFETGEAPISVKCDFQKGLTYVQYSTNICTQLAVENIQFPP